MSLTFDLTDDVRRLKFRADLIGEIKFGFDRFAGRSKARSAFAVLARHAHDGQTVKLAVISIDMPIEQVALPGGDERNACSFALYCRIDDSRHTHVFGEKSVPALHGLGVH